LRTFQVTHEHYVLTTLGAQPKHALTSKKTDHYHTKLAEQKPTIPYANNSSKRIQDKLSLLIDESSPFKVKQKYVNYHHESEIAKYNVFKGPDAP
jgi:hypothetical protein